MSYPSRFSNTSLMIRLFSCGLGLLMMLVITSNTASAQIESLQRGMAEYENLMSRIDSIDRTGLKATEIEQSRVDPGEQSEFETWDEYSARSSKADSLKEVIRLKVADWYFRESLPLRYRLQQLLRLRYQVPVNAVLGRYVAEREMFPVVFSLGGSDSIRVPRGIAPEFKEAFLSGETSLIVSISLAADSATLLYHGCKVTNSVYSAWSASPSMNTTYVLKAMYGQDNVVTNGFIRCKVKSIIEDLAGFEGAGIVNTTLLLNRSYIEQGVQKRLILTSSKPSGEFSCHACAPHIGLAIFEKIGDNWHLTAIDKDLGPMGQYGEPAQFDWIKMGDDRFGLKRSNCGMNQGWEWCYESYYLPIAVSVREVLNLSTLDDSENAGIPQPCKTTMKVDYQKKSTDEIWPITTLTKTVCKTKKVKLTQKHETWRFDGIRFRSMTE